VAIRSVNSESALSLESVRGRASDLHFGARKVLDRVLSFLRGQTRGGHDRRACTYRPIGEGLESKTLLSDVLGWSGGTAGNPNSLITPANIATLTEQYSDVVDGPIIAEPLSAEVDVTVGPSQGTQTLVFVATENDSLYVFNWVTGKLAWKTSLLGPGETTIPESVTQTGLNGITSTPVIDRSTNTIYLVTSESYVAGQVSYYSRTLHAINMSDGLERPGSPVVIADTGYNARGKPVSEQGPSVRGTGAGSIGGRVYFYVPLQLQRPGLSIDGQNLVMAFGSIGDRPPFHGWILTYNTSTLRPTGVFNDTPNGSDGGIWNSGGTIQVDSQGYLYTDTGNGTFDTKLNRGGFPSRGDYGDSVLKFALVPGYKGPNGNGIKVVDYFTPENQAKLGATDGDLASSGVLILPDGWGGPEHPNLLLASGKSGTIYVINRDDMGHFHQHSDHIVQEIPGAVTSSFDTPAFFDNAIYYAGNGDVVKAFNMKNGKLVETGHATNSLPYPGASPVVSSDGTHNGIVWVISAAKHLIAYDATDLNKQLWSADLPGYSKFSIPAFTTDGHVEVGAGNVLAGFGLKQDAEPTS